MVSRLLPPQPLTDLAAYQSLGGGTGLERLSEMGPALVLADLATAGLRGRGGAGFPTAVKWRGVADAPGAPKFVVCNAAEGEPGTFKDRALIRTNPYAIVEGLAIAGRVVGAAEGLIGVKATFVDEVKRLTLAADEMAQAGMLDGFPVTIVEGPDDYLFGEETALLEVIEGRDALPRLHPPYVQGLFETPDDDQHPTVVNNAETLAHVPFILREGPTEFRSVGTERSPGTMLMTIGGDVATERVVEVPLGITLRQLIDDHAGGVSGGAVAFVTNGVSNAPLLPHHLDLPLTFEDLKDAGSGLGSAGFTVYAEGTCPIAVAAAYSAFNFRGSCGQCPPCKLGTEALTDGFTRLGTGAATEHDLADLTGWVLRITDSNRCGLGAGEQALARGFIEAFPEHLASHLEGGACGSIATVAAPRIDDWNGERFVRPSRGS